MLNIFCILCSIEEKPARSFQSASNNTASDLFCMWAACLFFPSTSLRTDASKWQAYKNALWRCVKSERAQAGWGSGVDGRVTQTQDFHPGDCCSCPVWNQEPALTCAHPWVRWHIQIAATATGLIPWRLWIQIWKIGVSPACKICAQIAEAGLEKD